MSDDSEKPIKQSKFTPEKSTENAESDGIVNNAMNQNYWNLSQDSHHLSEDESATHLTLSSDRLSDLKKEGLAEKFEIVDQNQPHLTNAVAQSFVEGLKAISFRAKSQDEAVAKQGEFSIQYIMRKCQDLIALGPKPPESIQPSQPVEKHHPEKSASGEEIAKHARLLGESQPSRWLNAGKIHKCNIFLDRVFRDMKVSLPWDEKHIPRVHNMKKLLSAANQDWEQVYVADKPIEEYKPKQGDIVIWDKKIYSKNYDGTTRVDDLHHCGIIGSGGSILYAGSDATHGYADSDFQQMYKSDTFGKPTIIFRSKHLAH